jgi:hypothetical protein
MSRDAAVGLRRSFYTVQQQLKFDDVTGVQQAWFDGDGRLFDEQDRCKVLGPDAGDFG